MKKPTLFEICKTSLYIGAIGYGGPAILAQMKKTMVHQKEWITEKEFMDALSLAQILPGATGVSLMGYIGHKLQKFWGGILMPMVYIFPATIAMLILAWAYFSFGNLSFIKSIMAGLGSLVVALLVNATIKLGGSVFKNIGWKDIKGLIISLVAFVGIFFLHLNVIYLILLSGILGIAFYYFTKDFKGEQLQRNNQEVNPSLLLEKGLCFKDFTPVIIIALIIGAILIIPSLRQIFTTFFNIGTFAFGGGFTTIPLIQHQVVDQLQWLNLTQFRDGIALGQITPGPVFITATFIGYKVFGFLGALVATLAIFIPSITAMIALSGIHAKVKKMKFVQVLVKGFLAGFIGLLIAVTLQFALKSLVSWQTWIIFISALVTLIYFKKDALWAILGTVLFSLFLI